MNTHWSDWLFWIGGWALADGGAILLLWAIIGDRSRGRRRCRKCWYDMGSIEPLDGVWTCPECGKSARNSRQLLRPRRRWRWALLTVVLVPLGGVGTVYPKARRDGWLSLLSNTALIELMPLTGLDGELGVELQQRVGLAKGKPGQSTFSNSDYIYLYKAMASGNVLARPISERWRATYGELIRKLRPWPEPLVGEIYTFNGSPIKPDSRYGEDRREELAQAMTKLYDIPADLTVRTRDRWPIGMPIQIDVRAEHWWPHNTTDSVRARWSVNGGPTQESRARSYITLPAMERTGPVVVDLEIDIMQERRITSDREEHHVSTESHSVQFHIVESIDEVIAPVEDPKLTQLLASEIHATRSTMIAAPRIWPFQIPLSDDDALAFGITAEFLCDGEVVGELKARWMNGVSSMSQSVPKGPKGEFRQRIRDKDDPGVWTLRVRSDAEQAARLLDAERYWVGEFTIPLLPPPERPNQIPIRRTTGG